MAKIGGQPPVLVQDIEPAQPIRGIGSPPPGAKIDWATVSCSGMNVKVKLAACVQNRCPPAALVQSFCSRRASVPALLPGSIEQPGLLQFVDQSSALNFQTTGLARLPGLRPAGLKARTP